MQIFELKSVEINGNKSPDGSYKNELGTQDDPPDEASDIVKRDSHGFDKHSFKAEPGKPKRSRRQHGSL